MILMGEKAVGNAYTFLLGDGLEMDVVRLDSVFKFYSRGEARIEALVDVNITVGAGEFVVVTGQSGCGKSTLLHIMGAMDTPSHGRVFLGKRDLSTLDDPELSRIRREEIGFVYQFFNLLPTMTTRENVALPLILQNISRLEVDSRSAESLARVGLSSRENHFPHQLSGGEMQRVAIARAVVARPRLILADEPTGNLDSRLGTDVLELLSNLCREDGFTIVMATHSPETRKFATREVQMLDGRILKDS